MASFGDILRYMRVSRKLRQQDVASYVGVAQETLSQYETGRRPCPPDIAARIALLLQEPLLLKSYCERCPVRNVVFKEVA